MSVYSRTGMQIGLKVFLNVSECHISRTTPKLPKEFTLKCTKHIL